MAGRARLRRPARAGSTSTDSQQLLRLCKKHCTPRLHHDDGAGLTHTGEAQAANQWFQSNALPGTAANGDTFKQTFMLKNGTYTFAVLGVTASDAGMIDWYVDDVVIATG